MVFGSFDTKFLIQFSDQMGVSVSNLVIQPVRKSEIPLLHETETDHGKANSVERGRRLGCVARD
jgi:hypothetical protein